MRADIHDGSEHTLQSEAGYIDARPHQPELPKPLAPHGRTIYWVKTRIRPFRANVSFHQLRTCLSNDVWHQAKRASVDDVICSHQHCWRYRQTECFHRLLVNDETEASWLLEWYIGGACPS